MIARWLLLVTFYSPLPIYGFIRQDGYRESYRSGEVAKHLQIPHPVLVFGLKTLLGLHIWARAFVAMLMLGCTYTHTYNRPTKLKFGKASAYQLPPPKGP